MTRFILPILLVLVACTLFFGFTRPIIDEISIKQAKADELDSALSNDKNLRKVREKKLADYNSFSPAELDSINRMLPDSIDNVRLIIDMNNIATKYNMRVKNAKIKSDSMAPQVIGSSQTYGSVTLSFNVSGSYNDLRLFLHDLETSLRLVDVTSLSFNASDKDMNDYSIEVRTYWIK